MTWICFNILGNDSKCKPEVVPVKNVWGGETPARDATTLGSFTPRYLNGS